MDRQEQVGKWSRLGQGHLFADWDPPGVREPEKAAFLAALERVDGSYPGGLAGYIENARRLLAAAQAGANPYEGFVPHRPDGIDLTSFDAAYDRYEAAGTACFARTAVVLVAGGLGERLGFSGIKLDIPVEVIENTTYLAHYAACLRAMEARMPSPRPVPLIIMTSADTHEGTVRAFERNQRFGLREEQVHLLQQELVPALADNEGRLARQGKYELVLKPHGHGDIHMLLHRNGLAASLHQQGIEFLMFIQDTNGQVFNALPAALGVSSLHRFDFNSLAVPRIPGEAAGGLVKLVGNGREMTLNVEYNQLDPLLRANGYPDGDAAGADGFSPFPGNINALVVRLDSYVRILERTRGIIAEFVNPKYADASRTTFKSPARLETMMQDLPKLFGPDERVGVTVFNRRWCFSANKNNVRDAAARQAAGGPPESAASAEADFYLAGRMKVAAAGMEVREAPPRQVLGVEFVPGPRVLLRPSFAMTLAEVREKIEGGSIEGEATLVLDGEGIVLRRVHLADGAGLVVRAVPGEFVRVEDRRIENRGLERIPLTGEEQDSSQTPETLRLRGYRMVDRGAEKIGSNEQREASDVEKTDP